ncbi:phosphoglycerate dehydrogenase [Tautonia plasticadhaerens]|uniref:D-3-phosphoglycerate dehydrogenase n=1 Tax=Tautonia plasticadhaerens TaxID=2527974 RepID=A0A518H7L9_9BACT|nr:phosphoglycerate dehydrogenase [Tautonia plasticadhaerens]QDV36857.1 D-3-phosphoglycerate dehydrogenase [Tautonia plasticadhaerens]
MPTALIGAGPIRNRPGPFRELLHRAGFRTIDPEGGDVLPESSLREALPGCEAIVAGGERLPADLIAACPRLRVIARTGVGYDAVDVPAATERGVVVTITPGTNQESVAEQAFGLLLAVTRRVALNDRLIRAGGWDRTIALPLRGRTLGLVGLGRIGRAMVPRARAFGMRVLAFDAVPDPAFDAEHQVGRRSLDDLLAESDVVSLHLPLTASTLDLIDDARLSRMRPGSILLNTARGGLVDEYALHRALLSGHLAGAGLDVYKVEPPPLDHPLVALPNVVSSPHIGGVDTLSMADMAEMAARCIVDLKEGRWPADCVVNPEVGPGWAW